MSENTAVALRETTAIWQDTEKIRALFAPTLTDKEFSFFVSLGLGLGANPFTREIWAVKYDANKPASVFLGRDFYRKKAQEQADYDGHIAQAVYENDSFGVVDGVPQHSFKLTERGKLMGAYGLARRKGITQPFFKYVELKEYDKQFSNWKTMPVTMIEKVAEAQVLRGAYQGIFAGTFDESEFDLAPDTKAPQSKKPITQPPQATPQDDELPPYEPPQEMMHNGDAVRLITEKQRGRLFAILKASGKSKEDLSAYLLTLALDSSTKIPSFLYDQVIEWAEGK
jgi:phage recombination protein Bet